MLGLTHAHLVEGNVDVALTNTPSVPVGLAMTKVPERARGDAGQAGIPSAASMRCTAGRAIMRSKCACRLAGNVICMRLTPQYAT